MGKGESISSIFPLQFHILDIEIEHSTEPLVTINTTNKGGIFRLHNFETVRSWDKQWSFQSSNNKRSRIGVRHATHKNFIASQGSERIETERDRCLLFIVLMRARRSFSSVRLRIDMDVLHEGKKGFYNVFTPGFCSNYPS